MNDQQVCSRCTGTGKCSGCGGTGNEKSVTPDPMVGNIGSNPGGGASKACAKCHGTGSCQKCNGSGKAG